MPCKLDGQNLAQWKVNNATVIYPGALRFGDGLGGRFECALSVPLLVV